MQRRIILRVSYDKIVIEVIKMNLLCIIFIIIISIIINGISMWVWTTVKVVKKARSYRQCTTKENNIDVSDVVGE